MAGVDYEHELNNGWDKWQNLVLTGLKENRDGNLILDSKVDEIRLEMARHGEQIAAIATLAHATDSRVNTIEVSRARNGSFMEGAWATLGVIGAAICAVGGLALGVASFFFGG